MHTRERVPSGPALIHVRVQTMYQYTMRLWSIQHGSEHVPVLTMYRYTMWLWSLLHGSENGTEEFVDALKSCAEGGEGGGSGAGVALPRLPALVAATVVRRVP